MHQEQRAGAVEGAAIEQHEQQSARARVSGNGRTSTGEGWPGARRRMRAQGQEQQGGRAPGRDNGARGHTGRLWGEREVDGGGLQWPMLVDRRGELLRDSLRRLWQAR